HPPSGEQRAGGRRAETLEETQRETERKGRKNTREEGHKLRRQRGRRGVLTVHRREETDGRREMTQ
ncbi:hypothetical protein KUCAC02_033223, partial [Chaenocephalus aceratus]